MNQRKIIKRISILLIVIQILMNVFNINLSNANIKQGDTVLLQGDHECDSLVEYQMDTGWWSYKIVWYVYYLDENNKFPAFCVEPAKEGVGTGYDSYDGHISKETDNVIWRILKKGYMGSSWYDWNLECDDDFYSANKIALHSYAQGISPKDKYVLGDRSVDGNSVEEIQRRGQKVLDVAQELYEYGLYGQEVYKEPQIEVTEDGEYNIETIDGVEYYIQNYKVTSNNELKSYNVSTVNFIQDTKIFDSNNNEVSNLNSNLFKIAIPIKNIKEEIKGTINISDAQIKTYPIYYAKSSIDGAQSYVTYTSFYEISNVKTNLNIDPNQCNLIIKKVDEQTKQPLENVEFELFDENKQSLGKWSTDENGIIEVKNLKPGQISIKEVNVNNKYILDTQIKTIELEWKKTSEIEIGNELKKGSIRIIKTDEDNNNLKLQGVEFEIYNDQNKLLKTVITDENGEVLIEDLDIGKYIIKEIKTIDGYLLNENEYIVEVKENKEEVVINITNKEQPKLPRTGF